VDDSSDTPTQEVTKPSFTPDSLKDIAGGRYEVLGVIGSGGAGVVYKARDTVLNKIVAIKKLLNSASESQALRFHREAKILASLKHPNVLGAIDFGLTDKNDAYLILDFLEGKTLAQWLKKRGAMPIDLALTTSIKLARGLAYAHGKNVAHRDIKPANVMMLEEDGGVRPQLVDFGLAKDVEAAQDFTTPGVAIGTPKYMPPEQVQGANTDQRSDIYSFGCLLFEMVTGTPPFKGDSILDTLNMHTSLEAPSVIARMKQLASTAQSSEPQSTGSQSSDSRSTDSPSIDPQSIKRVPESLDQLVRTCMEKSPADRFQNGEALLNALLAIEIPADSETEDSPSAPFKLSSLSKAQKLSLVILLVVLPTAGIAIEHYRTQPDKKKEVRQKFFIDVEHVKSPGLPDALNEEGDKVAFREGGRYSAQGASDKDFADFMKKKIKFKELELFDTSMTPAGLKPLQNLPTLDSLYIRSTDSKEWIDQIAKLSSLSKIEFWGARAKPIAVRHHQRLAALPYLSSLTFKDCKFDKDSIKELTYLPRVHHLTFQRCSGLSGDNLAALHRFKGLRYLSLNQTDADAASLKALSRTAIKSMKISYSHQITMKTLPILATFKSLENVDLRQPGFVSIDCHRLLRNECKKLNRKPIHLSVKVVRDSPRAEEFGAYDIIN